jgi:hypothetical protein
VGCGEESGGEEGGGFCADHECDLGFVHCMHTNDKVQVQVQEQG